MIYIICNDYDYVQGGASKVAIQTANILFEKGHKVVFFCGVSDKEKSILNRNILTLVSNEQDCLSQNNLKGLMQGLRNKKAEKVLLDYINKQNEEIIIHIHGWTKALSSSFVKRVKKFKNVKVVLTLHEFFTVCPNGGFFNYKTNKICHKKPMSLSCVFCNCDSRNFAFKMYRVYRTFYQNTINKLLKNIDMFLAISSFEYDILKPYLKNKEVRIVNNPIENTIKERIEAEKNKDYYFIGRISQEKGIDLLCSHFVKNNRTLYVVGDGDQNIINKYKENENIIFLGWKTQAEIQQIKKKARAIFLPSIWYEGALLVVVESCSTGVPVAVSSLCAGSSFVDETTGIKFNPYSEEEFLDTLTKLDNNQIIEELSKNAFNNYWNNPLDEERYYSSLMEVYNSL